MVRAPPGAGRWPAPALVPRKRLRGCQWGSRFGRVSGAQCHGLAPSHHPRSLGHDAAGRLPHDHVPGQVPIRFPGKKSPPAVWLPSNSPWGLESARVRRQSLYQVWLLFIPTTHHCLVWLDWKRRRQWIAQLFPKFGAVPSGPDISGLAVFISLLPNCTLRQETT